MNLRFILMMALRYLFRKKSTSAINILTWIAMAGMMFGAMALVLVLSVFNGFENLVISLYSTFDPDIKVTPASGKVFNLSQQQLDQLRGIDGVTAIANVLEEQALLQYNGQKTIATLKGVDEQMALVNGIDSSIIRGEYRLQDGEQLFAVLGWGVENQLGVNVNNPFTSLEIFIPKKGKKPSSNVYDAFNQKSISPIGTFSIQESFDSKYVFVPISFLRELMEYETELTALEIALDDFSKEKSVKKEIAGLLGSDFEVNNRFEQNKMLYRIMKTEKWAVFLILTLILIVASFNIIGSLSMMVIEKSRDISVLKAMGSAKSLVRNIFITTGGLMSVVGGVSGVLLALLICFLQQKFKLITIQGTSFMLDAYPVDVQWLDVLLILFTIFTIGLLASVVPAQRAAAINDLVVEKGL